MQQGEGSRFMGPLGISGRPRAKPYFNSQAEDGIRHPHVCCGPPPGPSAPEYWYESGLGFVTKYFADVVPYNQKESIPGSFRCQVLLPNGQPCPFEVKDEAMCCSCPGTPCWEASGGAPITMLQHIQAVHGIVDPAMQAPKRQWQSDLCATEGCLDVWCCASCHGSRQMTAMSGWEDTFDAGWCAFFTLLGLRVKVINGRVVVYYVPPHFYVALFTRRRMVDLNNIDEGFCSTCMIVSCCPVCSIAQTYRELAASGVWTGSNCGGSKPAYYGVLKKQLTMVPMNPVYPYQPPMPQSSAANPVYPCQPPMPQSPAAKML